MGADPEFVRDIEARAAQGDEACKAASWCLKAIRQVIVAQACDASPTAYFAATVMSLQKHLEQKQVADQDRTTSALLLILRRTLEAVSPNVVSARANDVIATLDRALKHAEVSEEVVRQSLGCLATVAGLCYDAASRPNRKLLKPVFQFMTDSRPAVRQRAMNVVILILRRAGPAADQQTLEFSATHLSQMVRSTRPDRSLEENPASYAMVVLKGCAQELSAEELGEVFAALLTLPEQLGQHPCAIEAFEFMAGHINAESEEERTPQLVERCVALAAKVLPTLMGLTVAVLNVAYVSAYVRLLAAAAAALSGTPGAATTPTVAKQQLAAVKKILALFSERDPSLLKCVRLESLRVLKCAGEYNALLFLDEMPEACRPLLQYEFKSAWQHELLVMAGVFDAMASARTSVAPAELAAWTRARFEKSRALLSELVQIRDKAKAAELAFYGKELMQCIGSGVAAVGPDAMIELAPLQLLEHSLTDYNYEQASRSWLLLTFREHIRRASFHLFVSTFLPLASTLKSKVAETAQTSPIQSKRYATLLEHVWATLPAFCDEPLDLAEAFMAGGGRVAKQLVAVLQHEPDLRDHVWAAFARLCAAAKDPPSPLSTALQSSNLNCLRTLSQRVMPELFTAFLKLRADADGLDATTHGHSRHAALDALQKYAAICEPSLIASLFKTAVQRLLKVTTGAAETGDVSNNPIALADLANALVPYVSVDVLDLVLKVFTPMLKGAGSQAGAAPALSGALQRAAYKAMRGVMEHPEVKNSQLASVNGVLEFWTVLRDARQTCEPAALKSRIAAVSALLTFMESRLSPQFGDPSVRQQYVACLNTVLPEVLFHLRDQSTAVREVARECLHTAAATAFHNDLQTEIITLLSAGLAGLTAHSKASTLDALSRLVYEHSKFMASSLRDRLIRVILLLLQDADLQVWKAALKFAKVVVYVGTKDELAQYMPLILRMFDSQHLGNAKCLVRHIIERMAKVLPQDFLTESFPRAHMPLLQHVQRGLARKGRPKAVLDKAAGGEQEDADMEGAGKKEAAQESFEDFQAGDDDGEEAPAEAPQPRAKRGRGTPAGNEPKTSAVAAHESVQQLLDAWEAESDGESDDDGMGGGRRRSRPSREGKRKRDAVEASTWIREDQDVPIDFMSADAAHSVLTTQPRQMKRRRGVETSVGGATAENKMDALRRLGLRFQEDGRLVINEAAQITELKEAVNAFGAAKTTADAKPLSKLAALRAKRAAAKAQARAEKKNAHIIKGLDNYKPKKKSAGDAKKKGAKLEPFAYVRLNPKVTKEKFKDKATASFAKVLKGAKKGVLKGLKAKARDTKMNRVKDARKHKKMAK